VKSTFTVPLRGRDRSGEEVEILRKPLLHFDSTHEIRLIRDWRNLQRKDANVMATSAKKKPTAAKKKSGGGGKVALPDVMTMGQAAAALGVSRQAIWHAVNRGRLRALRFQHVVLIPKEALNEYQRTKSKGGRPKKKPEGRGR
jgi:excisionase family DNA binding protein